PGLPQPHQLHRQKPARDRRIQTPTTPSIGMSHSRWRAFTVTLVGSPPHSRGRPLPPAFGGYGLGLTPAFAGKTSCPMMAFCAMRAHPRIRGEDQRVPDLIHDFSGSPPHSRGRPGSILEGAFHIRLTPAFAGKTPRRSTSRGLSRAHPRIRGEDSPRSLMVLSRPGSPPHSRGRPFFCCPSVTLTGLTPAFAGKTRMFGGEPTSTRAHPRIRGEDFCAHRPSPP
ncbi:hypothetical protein SAMN05443377_1221, partial [Propionibacterium cyclohexanicum]